MLPCLKYLFLGEFLLLAQQNTKCHDLGMLAGRLTALLCLWHTFNLLANRIQAAYYWIAV